MCVSTFFFKRMSEISVFLKEIVRSEWVIEENHMSWLKMVKRSEMEESVKIEIINFVSFEITAL